MNETNTQDHLNIQQHLQLKATAEAINPLSPHYNLRIAHDAQELNRLVRRKWQPPLELFIRVLAAPDLSNQVAWIMDARPGTTLADAVWGVFGLSTYDKAVVETEATEATLKDSKNGGGDEDVDADIGGKGERLREGQSARRRQLESDRLLDAVQTLMQLHAVHNA
ncbi:hypothetical protein BG015_001547 [Linnemannia schmuckeri]|uniref:Uncharacterized protein n=1 Tax=Linnemannia schmuckeri TaxID=64567 RepID=A0A9P5V6V4_9FUNG|nr:hypothetical protein BG015_001547 [Linnemannia schmuckeri]